VGPKPREYIRQQPPRSKGAICARGARQAISRGLAGRFGAYRRLPSPAAGCRCTGPRGTKTNARTPKARRKDRRGPAARRAASPDPDCTPVFFQGGDPWVARAAVRCARTFGSARLTSRSVQQHDRLDDRTAKGIDRGLGVRGSGRFQGGRRKSTRSQPGDRADWRGARKGMGARPPKVGGSFVKGPGPRAARRRLLAQAAGLEIPRIKGVTPPGSQRRAAKKRRACLIDCPPPARLAPAKGRCKARF